MADSKVSPWIFMVHVIRSALTFVGTVHFLTKCLMMFSQLSYLNKQKYGLQFFIFSSSQWIGTIVLQHCVFKIKMAVEIESFPEFCRTKREKSHIMSKTCGIPTWYVYVCLCIYTCLHSNMHMTLYICVFMFMGAYIHICVYICIYIHDNLDLVCGILIQKTNAIIFTSDAHS